MRRSGFWFLVVGGCAAVTHGAVLAGLARIMRPELANAIGFLVAFSVSFVGHSRLTFPDPSAPAGQGLLRFGITSLAGFVLNEGLFTVFHAGMGWTVGGSWLIATGLTAVQTFFLGKCWAFRRR